MRMCYRVSGAVKSWKTPTSFWDLSRTLITLCLRLGKWTYNQIRELMVQDYKHELACRNECVSMFVAQCGTVMNRWRLGGCMDS